MSEHCWTETTRTDFSWISDESHSIMANQDDPLEALLADDTLFAKEVLPLSTDSMKSFLMLKSKIIDTNKLIRRYQGKVKDYKELQTSLFGLKEELKLLHQSNNHLLLQVSELQFELEESRDERDQQKIYIEQLNAKLEDSQLNTDHSESEVDVIRAERDAFREENEHLRKKIKRLRHNASNTPKRSCMKSTKCHSSCDIDELESEDESKEVLHQRLRLELNELTTAPPSLSSETKPFSNNLEDLFEPIDHYGCHSPLPQHTSECNSSDTDEDPLMVTKDRVPCAAEECSMSITEERETQPSPIPVLTPEDTEDKDNQPSPIPVLTPEDTEDRDNQPSPLPVLTPEDTENRDNQPSPIPVLTVEDYTISVTEDRDNQPSPIPGEDSTIPTTFKELDCQDSLIVNTKDTRLEKTSSSPLILSGERMTENLHLHTQATHTITGTQATPIAEEIIQCSSHKRCTEDELFGPSPKRPCLISEYDLGYELSSDSEDDDMEEVTSAVCLNNLSSLQSQDCCTVVDNKEEAAPDNNDNNDISISDDLDSSFELPSLLHLPTLTPLPNTPVLLPRETNPSPPLPILKPIFSSPVSPLPLSPKSREPVLPVFKSTVPADIQRPSPVASTNCSIPHSLVIPTSPVLTSSKNSPFSSPVISPTVCKNLLEKNKTNSFVIEATATQSSTSDHTPNTESDAELMIDLDDSIHSLSIANPSVSQATPSEPYPPDQTATVDVLTVGYSNPSLKIKDTDKTDTPPQQLQSQRLKQIVADGATGQWVKESSPSLSSRSTSPLLGRLTPDFPLLNSQSTSAKPHPPFSQAQQELKPHMRCPKPLPPWLAETMLQVQDRLDDLMPFSAPLTKGKKSKKVTKKPKNPIVPLMKTNKKQKLSDYVSFSLEHLMLGNLHLSTVITMFSIPTNVSSYVGLVSGIMKFLKHVYHPRFSSILELCWDRCSAVIGGTLDSLSPRYVPPLPRMEALLIALLLNVCQLNPEMGLLLPELMKQLRESILGSSENFHTVCIMCRIYASLCRLQADLDQIQFICCELLLKSTAPNHLPTLVSLAAVWPYSLARSSNKSNPPLFVENRLQSKGVEYQPLSFTLEVVAAELNIKQAEPHKGPLSNARILCKWERVPQCVRDSLTSCLIDVLKTSEYIYIKSPPNSPFKPCPSKHAYAIVMALRVLSAVRGWAWSNDLLIRQHLWPLLQQWNKDSSCLREATIVCILRLIGFVGQLGLCYDPKSSSIQQLQKVLTCLLQKCNDKTKKVTLPIQLAAVDALFDLCPPSHSNATQICSVVNQWILSLPKLSETIPLVQEYNQKIEARRTSRTFSLLTK